MKLAMHLPTEVFPAAVPWWNTRAFRWTLLVCGLLLVGILALLQSILGMNTQQFWREPFCLLVTTLGAIAVLLHAWMRGEEQSNENHEALCAQWYMHCPQKLLEEIDGQVYQNRVVSATELRVLDLQYLPSRLIVYCQSGDRVLALHFGNLTSNPYLRNLQEIDEATAKAHFLQHNREVYQSLYGAPEHW